MVYGAVYTAVGGYGHNVYQGNVMSHIENMICYLRHHRCHAEISLTTR
jgi:hypothetical protein